MSSNLLALPSSATTDSEKSHHQMGMYRMNENESEAEKEVPFLAPENMAFVHCPEC